MKKKEFYSNCLYEAIKAKIKDLKNVHIHIMFNLSTSIFPHFWWDDSEKAFNFTSSKKRKWQVLLFKGKIVERNLKVFTMYSNAQNMRVFYSIKRIFHKENYDNLDLQLDN